jgi:SAM-dependent methyltransferase
MTLPTYELTACPVCACESSSVIADRDAVQREVEMLWEFHGARLQLATPVAHLVDRVAFSQHAPLQIVRCDECGLVYRNPRERDVALREAYGDEEVSESSLSALFETQRAAYVAQAERLAAAVGRAGRVLEVGSYVGGFLAAATEADWNAEGLDVNAGANTFARSRGLRVTQGDLSTYPGAGHFDAVAIWNCFDQLPEPAEAARRAHGLLREGGVLAVRVPNGAFYATVRERLDGPASPIARALLAHNNLLGFPYQHGFTPGSLSYLLERAGFTIETIHGDTLVPIADEWTRPWAALEERLMKSALRVLAHAEADAAPWLEVYARA